MKKDEYSWLMEKYTHISTALNNAYKLYSKPLTDVIIVYLALIALSFFIVAISGFVGVIIPIDLVDYINMSSSLLLLFVTSAYVVFTYKILKTTEESTKQSQIVVQQTANAQKIAYLERQLELFYLPLESLLRENHPKALELAIQSYLPNMRFNYYYKNIEPSVIEMNMELNRFAAKKSDEFENKYNMLRPFNYLVRKESPKIFGDLFVVTVSIHRDIIKGTEKYQVESPFTFDKEKNIDEYNRVQSALKNDIDSLRDKLENLVNL